MPNTDHIKQLEEIRDQWRSKFGEWVEFLEPDYKFNLNARKPDEKRMFKYLCQMCSLHTWHFVRANQIKSVYLVDGYIAMAKELNSYGIYLFARSMLELNAYLYDVRTRLEEVRDKPKNMWVAKGEEFFKLIIRARFGTSDPKYVKLFLKNKFPKGKLDPLNISTSISLLKGNKEFGALAQRYNSLSDSVHHNLSSHALTNQGTFMSNVARSQRGGVMMSPKETPVTKYQYPADSKGEMAVEKTAKFMVENCEATVKWLSNFPETPFSQEQIIEMTGTQFGMTQLPKGFDN